MAYVCGYGYKLYKTRIKMFMQNIYVVFTAPPY